MRPPRKPPCHPHLLGVGLLGLLFASAVPAADEPKPRWEWGVGAVVATLRDYAGSDNYRTHLLPFPWLIWRSDRLYIGRGGTHGVLWRGVDSEVDVTLSFNPSVHQNDNPERAGMPKLDPIVEIGLRPRLGLWRDDAGGWRLDARLPIRRALAWDGGTVSAIGWHMEPGLRLSRDLDHGWSWGLSTALEFADRDYVDYFYAVDPVYATATRPAFKANGGFAGWQIGGSIGRQLDGQQWSLFLRYEDLSGAAFVDSPLVSSLHGGTIGVAWLYRIQASKRLVQLQTQEEP